MSKAKVEKINLVENFWNQGVCLQVSARRYGGNAKISDSLIESKGLSPDVVKAMNSLFTKKDMDKLKVFNTIKSKVNTFLSKNSLETPYLSTLFIPKNKVEEVNEKLKEFKAQWLDQAETFFVQYSYMKNNFAAEHPELYADTKDKYPCIEKLRKMFVFEWRFTEVNAPSSVSSEIQEEELRKIKQSANDVINSIINQMLADLQIRIENLADKVENGNTSKAALNPIINFCKSFKEFKADFIDKDLSDTLLDIQRLAESNAFIFDSDIRNVDAELDEVVFPLEDKLEELQEKAESAGKKRELLF